MNAKQQSRLAELEKIGEVSHVTLVKKTVYVVLTLKRIDNSISIDTWKITRNGRVVLVG